MLLCRRKHYRLSIDRPCGGVNESLDIMFFCKFKQIQNTTPIDKQILLWINQTDVLLRSCIIEYCIGSLEDDIHFTISVINSLLHELKITAIFKEIYIL